MSRPHGLIACLALLAASAPLADAQSQQRIRLPAPLASWQDTDAQKAITDFVNRVTEEKSPDFV
ncbi:MAG: haloacid dehalogenase-like hydrolase, partial [Chthoniobacterales bacterium]